MKEEIARLSDSASSLVQQNEALQSQMDTQLTALIRRLDQPSHVSPHSSSSAAGLINEREDLREMQHHVEL